MRNEISQLKKYAASLKEAADRKTERDGEGRPVIRVGVNERESLFDPFSVADRLFLSEEFTETLESRAKGLFKEKQIAVAVVCQNGCQVSEADIKGAIANTYTDKLTHQIGRYGRNGLVTRAMFLVGLLFLAASLTLVFTGLLAEMFTGVLDIVAWVFLWEAVDKFFFERSLLKMDFLLYGKLARANVTVIS